MKWLSFLATVALLFVSVNCVRAQPSRAEPKRGDTYELTLTQDTAQSDNRSGRSSSHDQYTLIERVVEARADGQVLEYDLPNDARLRRDRTTGIFQRASSSRRASAETDVAVAQLMGRALSLEEALRERARDTVSGTISVKFDTAGAGEVQRRTTVTKLEIGRPNGLLETQTTTETLERRLVPS
jgi:hypothetical protein